MTRRYHHRTPLRDGPAPVHRTDDAAALARAWCAAAGADGEAALAAVLERVRARYRVPRARLGEVLPPPTAAVAAFCARWSLSPALVWTLLLDAAKLGLGIGRRFPGQGLARRLGPLSFENEPGYLRGMLRGFARMLEGVGRELTPGRYRALHDACVEGVAHPDGSPFEPGFARRPWRCGFMWNIEGALPAFPTMSREAWAELLGERLVHVPRPTYIDRAVRDLLPARPAPARCLVRLTWMPRERRYCLTPTLRDLGVAALREALPRRVASHLARWRRERDEAARAPTPEARRRATLGAITRLCRALEMGHYFADANARTACVLVLHGLLLAEGFGPVVLEVPWAMDGYLSAAEMVACVERGFEHVARVREAFGA